MVHTGRRMTVEVTERPIEFHGKPAILSVVRDITERERAMVALQAAKDYAENIINSSLDMIVSVDTSDASSLLTMRPSRRLAINPTRCWANPCICCMLTRR